MPITQEGARRLARFLLDQTQPPPTELTIDLAASVIMRHVSKDEKEQERDKRFAIIAGGKS